MRGAREDAGDSGGRGGFSERSPSPPRPLSPEERLGIGLTFPLDLRAHARWARFPARGLWSRRLTESPRPSNYRPRRGRRFPKGDRKVARRALSFGRARKGEIPLASFRRRRGAIRGANGGRYTSRRGNALPGKGAYPQSAYRKGGVFNLRLNTPVAKATSLFRKRNSEPLTAPSAEGALWRKTEQSLP